LFADVYVVSTAAAVTVVKVHLLQFGKSHW